MDIKDCDVSWISAKPCDCLRQFPHSSFPISVKVTSRETQKEWPDSSTEEPITLRKMKQKKLFFKVET